MEGSLLISVSSLMRFRPLEFLFIGLYSGLFRLRGEFIACGKVLLFGSGLKWPNQEHSCTVLKQSQKIRKKKHYILAAYII